MNHQTKIDKKLILLRESKTIGYLIYPEKQTAYIRHCGRRRFYRQDLGEIVRRTCHCSVMLFPCVVSLESKRM